MGFWNNLFARKGTENKSSFEPSLGNGFQFSDDPVNSNAAIYGVISRLSNTIATLPLNLFNSKRQPVNNEDVSVLVGREPNPIFSAFDLWNKAETDRNEHGNAFILIERDEYYQPVKLWNINASDVVVLQDEDTNALFYRIRGKNNSIVVDSSNVIHLKNITGSNRLMGISPLNVLSDSLKYDQAFEQFSLSEMMKRDSFSVTYDRNLDKERRDAVVESIKRFVKDNGGVLFNEPGAEVELMQRSIATTDVARNDNTFYRRVANAFNVPLSFLNATEATVDSENNMMYFVQMTLMPILKQYEFELNKKLLTDSQKRAGFYFKFDERSLLRGDTQAQAAMLQQEIRNGVSSPNDILEQMGRPRSDDPTMDKHYVSGDIYPIDWTPEQRRGASSEAINPQKGGDNNEVLQHEQN